MAKTTWRGEGLFGLYFHITAHHQKQSGQELTLGMILEIGDDAEAMKEYCLLITPVVLLSLLSFRTQDHQAEGGNAPSVIRLPHQLLIKTMYYSWNYGGFFFS